MIEGHEIICQGYIFKNTCQVGTFEGKVSYWYRLCTNRRLYKAL